MVLAKKITTCLLFDGQAGEAARHYTSIFPGSKITSESPLVTVFQIEGQEFMALNGPKSAFTWAVSLLVSCETQEEIDGYWEKLSKGGEEQPCGWVKDKYGLSWQIVPAIFSALLEDKDRAKAGRAMQAMMRMKKIGRASCRERV